MANIFIGYSRADEEKVGNIVRDIHALGHETWFDHELSGGQNWWDKILEEIRSADIFVFILSQESRESTACSREYEYAHALGKPIIPIQVEEGVSMNLLPPTLSQFQIVDYLKPDREATFRFARSLTGITSFKPLPDPLPEPPEVPLSHLESIRQQVESSAELVKLKKRRDLLAFISDEIQTEIIEVGSLPESSSRKVVKENTSRYINKSKFNKNRSINTQKEKQHNEENKNNSEGFMGTIYQKLFQPKIEHKIFISYRRSDSQHITGRIYDRLIDEYNETNIFKDVDSIPLGVNFREHLNKVLSETTVFLVVIGDDWVGKEEKGRRIDHDEDFVRIELATALSKEIPIIPLLIDKTDVPKKENLPGNINSLTDYNGIKIRPDPDFKRDMEKLISGVNKFTKQPPA